jgi:hypothetical protein
MGSAPTNGPPSRSLELIDAVADAFNRADWARLRVLYHDEARLSTVAAHERIVGPDELVRIFAELENTTYAIGETVTEAIDDDAVIVSGHMRYPLEDGGVAYAEKSWVLTFKDGLLFRSKSYASTDKARTAYQQYGVALGM